MTQFTRWTDAIHSLYRRCSLNPETQCGVHRVNTFLP
jgi:hypothetical protein